MLRRIKQVIIFTTAFVVPLSFAAFSFGEEADTVADESDQTTIEQKDYEDDYNYDDDYTYEEPICEWYDHDWMNGGSYCVCMNCGETKSHDWDLYDVEYPDCYNDGWETYECFDCNAVYDKTLYSTGHSFTSSTEWYWDFNAECFKYSKFCDNCDVYKYVTKTVKKKKTKRIFPKSFKKKAKKIKVSCSNKKIAKVYKNGKVKGKKRGTCIVTYKVKYKKIGWVKYKCLVKVK